MAVKEYIEREKALEITKRTSGDYATAFSMIRQLPAADVAEVVHGEWATNPDDIYWGNPIKRKYCTVCKNEPHFDREECEFILTDYCPNCGAKMDGGE